MWVLVISIDKFFLLSNKILGFESTYPKKNKNKKTNNWCFDSIVLHPSHFVCLI